MILLKTQDLKTRLTHLGKTIECGLHSGIPVCCVHYYATEWLWLTTKQKNRRWKKIDLSCLKAGVKNGPGYIPCPDCLIKGNFIKKLKKCNCFHKEECAGSY